MMLGERRFVAIVGAPKAGTTSLHHYLAQHPDICMSRPKEPHFFDAWYEQGPARYLEDCFAGGSNAAVLGEATTSSLGLPFVAERIASFAPATSVIICLRDPVDRAHSAWWMHHRSGIDPAGFTEAIRANEDQHRAGVRWDDSDGPVRWAQTYWEYVRDGRLRVRTYLDFGHYGPAIRRYRRFYPAGQLHIVSFARLAADPRSVVRDIFGVLGVDTSVAAQIDTTPRNVGNTATRAPSMPVATREWLWRHFAESEAEVADILSEISGGQASKQQEGE